MLDPWDGGFGTRVWRAFRVSITFLLLLFSIGELAAEPAPLLAPPADHAQRLTRGLELFQKEVRPLLVQNCLKCHGGEKIKADFDLSTREGLLKGGVEGLGVKLYDAKSSPLLQLLTHEKEPHMPSKGEKLSMDAVAKIAAWIDDGAPYDKPLLEEKQSAKRNRGVVAETDRQWWAFRPLQRVTPPLSGNGKTIRNPIDRFIFGGRTNQDLKPAPAADRRTLIRPASLGRFGLPPTPEEVAAFERDRSPDAWPSLIARLLASPRYGERWARHWLDVARFAESSGFEHDTDRPSAYHYRDFLIKALNADMPYDQFVRWQLAGDEFEPGNPLALMATGFLGAGVFPTQITANEVERTRYDAMDDMLSTTSTAMLGLTVGCARCHDHKFDPIPTRDYYRMLSTFTTTVRSDLELDMHPERTRSRQEAFAREHAPYEAALSSYEEHVLPGAFEAWLGAGASLPPPTKWELLEADDLKSKAGATFKRLEDGSYLAEGKNGDSDTYTFTAQPQAGRLRAVRLDALADPSMPKGGPGRADNGNFGLSRIRVFRGSPGGAQSIEVKLSRARATFEQNTNNLSIASALDANPKTGWAVDPKFAANHSTIIEFEEPLSFSDGDRLEVRLEFDVNARHNIGRLRLAVTGARLPRFEGEEFPAEVLAILDGVKHHQGSTAQVAAKDRDKLVAWWKVYDPGWQSLHDMLEAHAREKPQPRLTKVLACAEGFPAVRMNTQGADFFNETQFLQRGSTDLKQGVASQGFLQVLMRDGRSEQAWRWQPPEGAKFSGRRRSLANWMTDADEGAGHLLSRVMVNRVWQHHFGEGLVATPNDFGAQGAKPNHPELLDWLAAELIRGGWRLKPIHQLIMTSALYQERAWEAETVVKTDSAKVSFAPRTPRRLEAEAIRDSLLFVAGVMDTNMFGPGTLDESTRRRSIYFTVKRSRMIPAMQVFDAPEPLSSQGVRPVTTVAPQALFLMNSPHVREWAAAFARRMDPKPGRSFSQAVTRAYLLALNRAPNREERSSAIDFIQQQFARHQAEHSPNAAELALTDFAQVVLSLNEFVYVY